MLRAASAAVSRRGIAAVCIVRRPHDVAPLPALIAGPPLTTLRAYGGFGQAKKGSASRLTEAERKKRIAGKTPEEKRQQRDAIDAAEMYLQQEFPEELALLLERKLTFCRSMLLRLTNAVIALERTEVEVGGTKRPLVQFGTIIKVSPSELSLTPHDVNTQAVLISRLSRYDPTMSPTKNGTKIRLTIEPVTRERREVCAAKIEGAREDYDKRLQLLRRTGITFIRELKLPSSDQEQNFTNEIERMHEEAREQGHAAFQEMIDEALAAADDEVVEEDVSQAV